MKMPYKSEKIKIEHTIYDKRIKIFDDEKDEIIKKYESGMSIRALSRIYKVDRNIIKCVINPDFKKEMYKNSAERAKKYRDEKRYSGKVRNEYMQKHRKYKNDLYKKGEIKL